MDARERWQALQSRLTAARTALDAGDRTLALAEVDAALAIDPSFLAAAALRERITAVQNPENPQSPEPATRNPLPDSRPLISTQGYAQFEQRARRRRVDRRIAAAMDAIAMRDLRGAAAALDEVIALDPNQPELPELTAAFDTLRRQRATPHRGPTMAAVVAFATVIFTASWRQHDRVLHSLPSAAIAPLVETRTPDPLDAPGIDAVAPSALDVVPLATSGHSEIVPTAIADRQPPALSSVVTPTMIPVPQVTTVVPPPLAVAPPAALPSASAPIEAPITPPATPPARVEPDDAQIVRVLQQYRLAYGALDASRARAIWPAVNEDALARAFDGLESQTLTFDSCRTQLKGDAAVATCQGTARYVPKIGSRDPRVEPRTWTFVMRRSADSWVIDSARAER